MAWVTGGRFGLPLFISDRGLMMINVSDYIQLKLGRKRSKKLEICGVFNALMQGKSGVYFLCLNGEVVYIGQAKNVLARIGSHFEDKKFDEAYFIPIESSGLCIFEEAMIRRFKPCLNIKKYERKKKMNWVPSIPKDWDDYYSLHVLVPAMRKFPIEQQIKIRNEINEMGCKAYCEMLAQRV